jgi:hypothetical protein
MATLDLTLAELRLAGLTNFTPEFGTKEADGVSVSTENVCKDFMLPFKFQRPVLVSETSDTGNIEATRTLVLTNSGTVLTLGRATFAGCKITVQTGFTSGSAQVKYLTAADTYETVTLSAGNSVEIVSNSDLYFYKRLRINNSIIINTNEHLIQNRRYLYPSVFPVVNRNKDTDFVVQNNKLYSKNSVFIRAGATLPPFYVESVGLLQFHTESDLELTADDCDDTCNGLEAGKDYFIYLIYSSQLFPNAKDNLGFKISLNDPDGISIYGNSDIAGSGTKPIKAYAEIDGVVLTADNCMCVGGFHTVLADCTALAAGAQVHPLLDYTAGAVHPFTVWDLFHRPEGSSVGMLYNPCINKWGSLYLLSERAHAKTGTPASYGGTYPNNNIMLISAANKEFVTGTTTGRVFPCLRGEQILSFQKQRFPTLQEFTAFTLGSPQGLAINGAANPVTTGAHLASDNTQIISYCGMFDGVGVLWQWGQENGYTSASDWNTNYNTTHDKDVKGDAFNAQTRVILGGKWSSGSHCGSRAHSWYYGALELGGVLGFRAVAEPRHIKG